MDQVTARAITRITGIQTLLANRYQWEVLRFFVETDTTTISLDQLLTYAASDADHESKHKSAIMYHHMALPRLAEIGCIEYEPTEHVATVNEDSPIFQLVKHEAR